MHRHFVPRPRRLVFVFWLSALAPLARAQDRYPALGLGIDLPAKYTPIPVEPSEPWIVLRYIGEKDKKKDDRNADAPEVYVIRIEAQPDPDPSPSPPPINSFERYLAQRMKVLNVSAVKDSDAREGWSCKEYDLRPKKGSFVGWACELRNDARTWVLLGLCAEPTAAREVPVWRTCVKKLEFFAPSTADADKWTKFYAHNPTFHGPELRVRLRAGMVGGWEAEDSDNYLIVYHTKKESLVEHLKKRLEGIRRDYVELFPADSSVSAVSMVRICQDREEFERYGGDENAAGFWNPVSQELVLFVSDDGKSAKEDAHIVLFHEAFHQYIHYAAGEIAPHSWFNEGYGDYFSGAVFNTQGEVGHVEVNPWRLDTIQRAISARASASWRDMIAMEKSEYYGPKAPLNYAMGWSMIYFLNKCKDVKKHPTWAAILPQYFETLKAASARERARLDAAGLSQDKEPLERAAKSAREEAAAAAFKDVDLTDIQEAWRKFTLELKAPK